jgi:hypothetical protein
VFELGLGVGVGAEDLELDHSMLHTLLLSDQENVHLDHGLVCGGADLDMQQPGQMELDQGSPQHFDETLLLGSSFPPAPEADLGQHQQIDPFISNVKLELEMHTPGIKRRKLSDNTSLLGEFTTPPMSRRSSWGAGADTLFGNPSPLSPMLFYTEPGEEDDTTSVFKSSFNTNSGMDLTSPLTLTHPHRPSSSLLSSHNHKDKDKSRAWIDKKSTKKSTKKSKKKSASGGGGGNVKAKSRPSFDKTQIAILTGWLDDNIHKPYPTARGKQDLADETGLSVNQVQCWLINRRMRDPRLKKRKRR